MRTRRFAGYVTAILATLVLAQPQAAFAAEPDKGADLPAKVQQLNRTAMQYFDDLNYAMAEKTLLEALAIVEKNNLTGPPALATNGNLAVIYSAGIRKPDKAIFHFKKALAIKPDLKLSKQRSTPETEAALARAKTELAGGTGKAEPPAEPGEGAFRCPTGGEVQAGDEITLKCLTSPSLQPATVMLYYKIGAAPEFEVQRTTKEAASGGGAAWVAKITGPRTQGTSVLFYFEANDPSGNTLASSGSDASPGTIAVKGGEAAAVAGPPPVAEGGEEEGEEEEEEGEEVDDNNPLAALERERWREHQGSKGTWWVGLGVGSGFGYAPAGATEAFGKAPYYSRVNSGIAWAATGQLVPEVGYFIGRTTAIALTGRNQAMFGMPAGAAKGANSVLLRFLFFSEEARKMRWYFATALGGGEGFRLQVNANVRSGDTGLPTGQTAKDSILGGRFLAGLGGGMQYKLSKHFRWVVETQALVGFTHVSAVLDLSTGLRWQF